MKKDGMKICIRMDDITPDMDWAKFQRFKALCDEHGIKPLIGVVPKNEDDNLKKDKPREDFWEYVKKLQADGWTVAQHGYTHVYTTKEAGMFPVNKFSEFAGVEYSEQYEAIKQGQDILREHGIETDIFMPPAHSFDMHTIKALQNLSYRRITDGYGKMPYTRYGMIFYPITFNKRRELKVKDGYTTFVVHSNTMTDNDFERYRKLFDEYGERIVPYSQMLLAEPVYRGRIGAALEYLKAVASGKAVELVSRKNR